MNALTEKGRPPTSGPIRTSRRARADRPSAPRLGAGERDRRRPAGRQQGVEPRRALRPDRLDRRHLRQTPPRPVRGVGPVPRVLQHLVEGARTSSPRLRARPHARPVHRGGVRIGTLICFESAFGYQVRPLVHDGAHVIVVSTNNRSYRRSANSASTSRSARCAPRRPAVRSCRPRSPGSPRSSTPTASSRAHDAVRPTIVQTTVEATGGETPYVRFGEWGRDEPAIAGVGVAMRARRARQRRRASLDSGTEPENVGRARRSRFRGRRDRPTSEIDRIPMTSTPTIERALELLLYTPLGAGCS